MYTVDHKQIFQSIFMAMELKPVTNKNKVPKKIPVI